MCRVNVVCSADGDVRIYSMCIYVITCKWIGDLIDYARRSSIQTHSTATVHAIIMHIIAYRIISNQRVLSIVVATSITPSGGQGYALSFVWYAYILIYVEIRVNLHTIALVFLFRYVTKSQMFVVGGWIYFLYIFQHTNTIEMGQYKNK